MFKSMNNYLKASLVVLVLAFSLPCFLGLVAEDKPAVKGIAFVSYDRNTKAGDICLINENGANMRRLTTDITADDTLPVWSPDWHRGTHPIGYKPLFSSYASRTYLKIISLSIVYLIL